MRPVPESIRGFTCWIGGCAFTISFWYIILVEIISTEGTTQEVLEIVRDLKRQFNKYLDIPQ